MANIIKLSKGLNIPLSGRIEDMIPQSCKTSTVGIVPEDFPGFTWKTAVKTGDTIAKGSPVMYAKENEKIKLVTPIGGVVENIERGERRKIKAVIIRKTDNLSEIRNFLSPKEKTEIIDILLESGLWSLIRQRPFDIVPDPDVEPRDIFITTFDSSPLAPDIISPADTNTLNNGIKFLSRLTSGKVYLNVRYNSGITSPYAVVTEFIGPHPAGNPGVQIANIKPVNKGEVVWTLDATTVIKIGKLLGESILDLNYNVAVTGPEVKSPEIVTIPAGAKISDFLSGNLKEHDRKLRIISGNVLTGKKENLENGFLRYPYRQITVIREGDNTDEFMGWASVSPKKYSVKRSFPAFLRGLNKPFDFDARIKGGHRAMIVSGEYDKVFPMDIYPEFLIKAILSGDIDKMEKLGIYEVAPEDFALPEFVDTSKLPLQKIVREGLDYLRKELN